MTNEKTYSATRLSQKLGMESKDVFALLKEHELIVRDNDHWQLTEKGQQLGGKMQHSDKFGEFIVWPESLLQHEIFAQQQSQQQTHLTATRIGEQINLPARMVNLVFSELGWMNKDQRGWMVSQKGAALGAEQRNSKQGFYVVWPANIIEHSQLQTMVSNINADNLSTSLDGHQPKNQAEQKICNWLYLHHICYAYNRTVDNNELYCSFYLPERKIYIDYFGLNNIEASLSANLEKKKYYQQHGLSFIELHDEDIQNLDQALTQKLLQFGLQLNH